MGITPMGQHGIKTQAFKLKGRLYTLTVLQLLDLEPQHIKEQFAHTVAQAPKLFQNTPLVFDVSLVDQTALDISLLCHIAREYGLVPIALQGANALQEIVAQTHNLAVLNASSTHDRPILEQAVETCSREFVKTRMLTTPVRSGQQIVAKEADLIVTSTVSHGAELLADGCIHVYGALRGRALAGISGDKDARIFCQSLEAELVSIAGFYKLSDALDPINVPCQIYLVDDHIHIEPL